MTESGEKDGAQTRDMPAPNPFAEVIVSVTIRKIPRSSGIRFKAIIRDRSGRALRSKTFTKLGLAREWAKRIEADRELVAARVTLADVVRGDPPRRAPLLVPEQRRWQLDWWIERLGDRLLTEIQPDDVRLAGSRAWATPRSASRRTPSEPARRTRSWAGPWASSPSESARAGTWRR